MPDPPFKKRALWKSQGVTVNFFSGEGKLIRGKVKFKNKNLTTHYLYASQISTRKVCFHENYILKHFQ